MNKPKNILIVRTDRIGDVVLTLPLASILKKHLPDCKITFMVRDYTRPLVQCVKDIDEIIVYEKNDSFFSLLNNIKNKSFDTCFVVHPKFIIALVVFLSGIKKRIGTGYRWYSFLFNKKIFEHRKYGTQHELNHNINLLKLIDIKEEVNETNVSFNLQVDENSKQNVLNKLKELNIDNNLPNVIIHPGSGGSAIDLPVSHFKEVVEQLAHELDINIFLTGSLNEKNICDSIMNKKNTYNLAGMFDLKELSALISQSQLMIANSTGPIHIAAALGINVIGFYPKIASCSVTRWGPYTVKRKIFTPTIDCNDCTREQCEKLNCMSSIKVSDIVNSAKEILNNQEKIS